MGNWFTNTASSVNSWMKDPSIGVHWNPFESNSSSSSSSSSSNDVVKGQIALRWLRENGITPKSNNTSDLIAQVQKSTDKGGLGVSNDKLNQLVASMGGNSSLIPSFSDWQTIQFNPGAYKNLYSTSSIQPGYQFDYATNSVIPSPDKSMSDYEKASLGQSASQFAQSIALQQQQSDRDYEIAKQRIQMDNTLSLRQQQTALEQLDEQKREFDTGLKQQQYEFEKTYGLQKGQLDETIRSNKWSEQWQMAQTPDSSQPTSFAGWGQEYNWSPNAAMNSGNGWQKGNMTMQELNDPNVYGSPAWAEAAGNWIKKAQIVQQQLAAMGQGSGNTNNVSPTTNAYQQTYQTALQNYQNQVSAKNNQQGGQSTGSQQNLPSGSAGTNYTLNSGPTAPITGSNQQNLNNMYANPLSNTNNPLGYDSKYDTIVPTVVANSFANIDPWTKASTLNQSLPGGNPYQWERLPTLDEYTRWTDRQKADWGAAADYFNSNLDQSKAIRALYDAAAPDQRQTIIYG